MKKVDILFLYETRVRELENICLVKSELEKRGFSVAFQNTWNSLGIKKFPYNAKVVVTHGMYHDGIYYFVKSLVGNVPKVVNLQWEQIGTKQSEEDDTSRYLLKGVAKQCMNICWGEQTYDRLINKCGFDQKHLRKTGQITLDFCRPELRKYYLSKNEIQDRYNISKELNINLFISSFSYVNLPKSIETQSDIAEKQDFVNFSRSSFNSVLEWFDKMLNKFPKEVVIYRPHPAEANNPVLLEMQEKYKGRFFVIGELSVKQWIAVADKVYTWYSTSAAEVHAFGVPFAILRPVKIPEHLEVSLYEGAEFITTYEEFEKTINEKLNSPLSEQVFNRFYYRDEQFSFVKVADAIEDVFKDDSYLIKMEEQKVCSPCFIKRCAHNVLTFIKSCLPKKSKLLEKYRKPEFDEYTLKLRKNNYASQEEIKQIQEKLKNILENKQ